MYNYRKYEQKNRVTFRKNDWYAFLYKT